MNKVRKYLFKRAVFYYIHVLAILFISFLLDRFFQMLIFIVLFNFIQDCFTYRFHADTIFPESSIKADNTCKLITIGVELLYLLFCKELDVSIYINLFVIFIISFLNALLQFYLIRSINNKQLIKDKTYILSKGQEVGLSELAINRLILKYIEGKTNQEIADLEFVEVEAIKQSIRRSKRKLNL